MPGRRNTVACASAGKAALAALGRGWRARTAALWAQRHPIEHLSLCPVWTTVPALLLSLILSACLMALAVRSGSYSWAAWVSLVPLFAAIRLLGPRRAMLCGALWGLSLYAFLVLGTEARIAGTIRSLTLLSAVPAIYAYLGTLLTRRIGFAPLFLGLGWIGVELALRPLGLHNGLLGGSQGDGTLMHLVGGVLGYCLVASLVAYVNASLLSVLSGVCSRVSEPASVLGSADPVGCVWHFVSTKCPSFGTHSSRPRAPPVSLA